METPPGLHKKTSKNTSMSRTRVRLRLPGERAPHGGAPVRKESTMKYLLMMNTPSGGPYQIAKWPQQDFKAHIAFMVNFAKKLGESGELVSAEGLAGPEQARRVRAGKDGKPITDGVFPESTEFLAGDWILELQNPPPTRPPPRPPPPPAPAACPSTWRSRCGKC